MRLLYTACFWLVSWVFSVLVEAHGHHGYASSSRLVDMCNWCGCSMTRQGAGTAGSSASKSGPKENCPSTIGTAICHTLWHLIQSCWRRAVALGRVVPPRRAIARQLSAREGEKGKERRRKFHARSLETLNLDAFVLS